MIALNEFLHKMIIMVLSCYGNMIFFLCQALIILGSFLFDKVVLMKIGLWLLPMRIGLWCCRWELGFEWIAIGLNHGLRLWIWIPLIKFVLPRTWIMGFSNIGKHKYSWVLNIIRCVYLKVDRWYLNKIRCEKKKKYPNNRIGSAAPLDLNIALMTVGDIYIPGNTIRSLKCGQKSFWGQKIRVIHRSKENDP